MRQRMIRAVLPYGFFLLVVICVGIVVTRPLFRADADHTSSALAPVLRTDSPIEWAGYGEQAIGASGSSVLASYGPNDPMPIASVAKVMVALAVLKQKPLNPGEQGPPVPITAYDVQLYHEDLAQGQSVAAVRAGEHISEYQALQGLLLPSANNLATTLTNWAFGSQSAYIAYANNLAKELAMAHTHFADASGFSPDTVGSASDLVLLGEAALQNPVIKQIVGTYTATIPVAGKVTNTNTDIAPGNSTGLHGLKTGNTDQAGGCFLFSTEYQGHTLVGAIVGAPDLPTALRDAPAIMQSFKSAVRTDN